MSYARWAKWSFSGEVIRIEGDKATLQVYEESGTQAIRLLDRPSDRQHSRPCGRGSYFEDGQAAIR